jgi:hypothetical protein
VLQDIGGKACGFAVLEVREDVRLNVVAGPLLNKAAEADPAPNV